MKIFKLQLHILEKKKNIKAQMTGLRKYHIIGGPSSSTLEVNKDLSMNWAPEEDPGALALQGAAPRLISQSPDTLPQGQITPPSPGSSVWGMSPPGPPKPSSHSDEDKKKMLIWSPQACCH